VCRFTVLTESIICISNIVILEGEGRDPVPNVNVLRVFKFNPDGHIALRVYVFSKNASKSSVHLLWVDLPFWSANILFSLLIRY
jgi:hypothetical protein